MKQNEEPTSTLSRRELMGAGAGLMLLSPSMWPQTLSRSTLITEPYLTVETKHGKLRGGHSRGALAFKGIPYAGSVSGANRFKPAPPVTPWTGVRDALSLGTPAMQSPKTVYGEKEPAPSEDCLVLNVWTPAIDGKKRPILFYNHGGGFVSGSAGSTAQDGAQLAANHDVVVVASNHRLGIFGYLYVEELGAANAGMSDIVDALKWVHENIAAFGGDPHNVTIFGESGGGAKTSALLGPYPVRSASSCNAGRILPHAFRYAALCPVVKTAKIFASSACRFCGSANSLRGGKSPIIGPRPISALRFAYPASNAASRRTCPGPR